MKMECGANTKININGLFSHCYFDTGQFCTQSFAVILSIKVGGVVFLFGFGRGSPVTNVKSINTKVEQIEDSQFHSTLKLLSSSFSQVQS